MPSDTPSHYRLTPKARQDLEGIWRYTAENWSVTQANKYLDGITSSFDTLVQTPRIVRERTEFDPPVHVFTHEKHIIVCDQNRSYRHYSFAGRAARLAFNLATH